MSTRSSRPSSAKAPVIRQYPPVDRIRGRALLLCLAVVALLGGAACSAGGPQASPLIVVNGAWVQVSGGVELPAAGYFEIVNRGSTDDSLVSASSPGAASVELHQTMPEMSGMIGMESVAQVTCPAGATVTFAPGGYHLMITGLRAALRSGDSFELDLVFEHAGTIVVQAEVRQV
jgi:periplasmic copper chaperone A